ncbi:MAG: hypothetical protein U0V74_12010 [Chitinophagales bacterium]
MRRIWSKNIIAFLFCLILTEALVRIVCWNADLRKLIFRGDCFTEKVNWANECHSYPTNHEYIEYDSLLGWNNLVEYQSNNYFGQKNLLIVAKRRVHPFEDSINKPEVSIFGDSFTFGEEVGDKETIPYFIQKTIKENVENCGVPGYGLDQISLNLKQSHQDKHSSKNKVIAIITDDLLRATTEYSFFVKPKYVKTEQGTWKLISPKHNNNVLRSQYTYRLKSVMLLDLVVDRFFKCESEAVTNSYELAPWILSQTQKDCIAHGTRLYLALIPTPLEVKDAKAQFRYQKISEWLEICCKETGLSYVDCAPSVDIGCFSKDQGLHWDARVNKSIGMYLGVFLLKEIRATRKTSLRDY